MYGITEQIWNLRGPQTTVTALHLHHLQQYIVFDTKYTNKANLYLHAIHSI